MPAISTALNTKTNIQIWFWFSIQIDHRKFTVDIIGLALKGSRSHMYINLFIFGILKIFNRRYAVQEEFKEKYLSTATLMHEEIKCKHGAAMTEDIADELRSWIKDCYEKSGKLPDFPSEEQGGSLHIFSRPGTESEVSRSSARSSKESRKTKDKSKSPARSGDLNVNENQLEENGCLQPGQSNCLPDIKVEIER